ncbi:hypothetical protein ACHWQZ_G007466 [Mnemiopsis leidyi]
MIQDAGIKTSPNDLLPHQLYKENIEILKPALLKLINLSLSTGNVEGVKLADIIPLLKDDSLDPNVLKNYRPVSNLCFLGKLIERVVLKRLNEHLNKQGLRCPEQYAYKKDHSTETLLIKITNDLLIAADEKSATVVMLLDLSAAFDTVDHNLLLTILEKEIGISLPMSSNGCVKRRWPNVSPLDGSPGKPRGTGVSMDRIDDSVTLKLPRRRMNDDRPIPMSDTSHSVVSCRKDTLVGTYNIRTAREGYKRTELVSQFCLSGIEILGIQEHRIVHQEPIRVEKFKEGVSLVTVSAWRNGTMAATGGVGFLLSSKAYSAISLIKPYGSRVLTMSFDGYPRLTAITVYSPTEAAPAEEAEDFHNTLRQAMNDVPAHHLLMTFGDMNARLGKENDDDPRWYFHDRTNRNGGLLRDTALECNMEITNTRFKKRIGKMWTHLSDGTLNKGQLDFVLVRQKWKNSVKNTEAYDIFNSLGSDHRVVVSRVKISLRKTKKPPQRVQYDYSALKRDEELQRKYAVAVQNRFSCLVEEGDDATESYGKLVAAVEAANKTLLSKRTNKKKYDPSSDRRVDAARRELFLAKDKYHHHTLEENREEVAVKKEALKSCYLTVEEEILQEKIRKVESRRTDAGTRKAGS